MEEIIQFKWTKTNLYQDNVKYIFPIDSKGLEVTASKQNTLV